MQQPLPTTKEWQQITIFNITGEEVYSIKPDRKMITLNLDFLASGLYIMQLQTEKKIQSIKIVKR